jgi:hypothetical protein
MSYAQADQKIVMHCTFSSPTTWDMVADLTTQTVSNTVTVPNPGGTPDPIISRFQGRVTQVTDDRMRFEFRVVGVFSYDALLDRYTGSLITNQANDSRTFAGSCQRQQKQF